MESKKCLDCNKNLIGRRDKKFCSDTCRNNYNNKLNSIENEFIHQINQILKKNRKILQQLVPAEGKIIVPQSRLNGFNFQYFTNTYETKTGKLYMFCYEYGYCKLEENKIMLVKRMENIV